MFIKIVRCFIYLSYSLLVANCINAANIDPTIVTLRSGKIRGHILKTANNKTYYAFQEIPYASPPVGKLRFKEPTPPKHWRGILKTTKNVKVCPQAGFYVPSPNVTQTEDCLYINVYTPTPPGSNALLPVLVWFYGGGFLSGDATFQLYGPEYFIDHDLIVVAMNYRLGPFGFLTTEDGIIPGNLALKDQNFALHWIKENIRLFGGDPTKVTIEGCSAGAVTVGYQLISKKSKGLFRAAILQSGTAISEFSFQPFARQHAFQLGRTLDPNFTSENSTELLQLLLKSETADIIQPIPNVTWQTESDIYWSPVIEDKNHIGAFITSPMEEDIRNGNINQVPILMGFTTEEHLMFMVNEVTIDVRKYGEIFDNNLAKITYDKMNISESDRYTVGKKIRKIYTDTTFQADFAGLVSYMSDRSFTTGVIRHAELQSHYTDVYLYQFSYKGPFGDMMYNIKGLNSNLVGHAEDIKYQWKFSLKPDINTYPKSDILTHRRFTKLLSNFVKYLNPTPKEDDLFANIIWPKVSPNNIEYLNINDTLEIRTEPKRYKQWKYILDAYNNPPFNIY